MQHLEFKNRCLNEDAMRHIYAYTVHNTRRYGFRGKDSTRDAIAQFIKDTLLDTQGVL